MDPAAAARSPTVALVSAGRVAVDVPCRTCDYNLRGLPQDDRCPECGTTVDRSIHSDRLCLTDPAWVNHLAAGALLMIIAVLGVTVVVVFVVVPAFYGPFQSFPRLALATFGIGFAAVGLVGCWKLAMPDPVRAKQRPFFNIEDMTRLLAAAAFLPNAWTYIPQLPLDVVIPEILFPLFVLAGPISVLQLFILLRRLALRIPNDSLARQTRLVMWGIVISVAAILVYESQFVSRTVAVHVVPWIMETDLLRWIVPASFLAFPVFGIWWIVLLFRYRKEFRRATSAAKAMTY